MSLNRRTRLGTVTVNDNVIAKIILRAVEKSDGKLLLSSERGRILGVASRVGVGDILGNFQIDEKENKFFIKFSGIIRFGSSIKNVTEAIFLFYKI